MATRVMDQAADHEAIALALAPQTSHGWLNRTVFYVPRFTRHLRRRLRSDMSLRHAWRSSRLRMHDYR